MNGTRSSEGGDRLYPRLVGWRFEWARSLRVAPEALMSEDLLRAIADAEAAPSADVWKIAETNPVSNGLREAGGFAAPGVTEAQAADAARSLSLLLALWKAERTIYADAEALVKLRPDLTVNEIRRFLEIKRGFEPGALLPCGDAILAAILATPIPAAAPARAGSGRRSNTSVQLGQEWPRSSTGHGTGPGGIYHRPGVARVSPTRVARVSPTPMPASARPSASPATVPAPRRAQSASARPASTPATAARRRRMRDGRRPEGRNRGTSAMGNAPVRSEEEAREAMAGRALRDIMASERAAIRTMSTMRTTPPRHRS